MLIFVVGVTGSLADSTAFLDLIDWKKTTGQVSPENAATFIAGGIATQSIIAAGWLVAGLCEILYANALAMIFFD